MSINELVTELKTKETILPRDVLHDRTLDDLASDLMFIFQDNLAELDENDRFKENYLALINYVYMVMLQKEPKKRNPSIFDDNIITYLLNTPSHAV